MAETPLQAEMRLKEEHARKQREAAEQAAAKPALIGKDADILRHLEPGEPVFIFRAKDILSIMALDAYAGMVEKFSPHSDHLAAIVDRMKDFRDWQHANPSKVKLPD